MTDLLNVGDILQTKSWGTTDFKITRVTKTLAMSKRVDDGYEHKFKREISYNMSHPYQQWNTVEYTVIKYDEVS